jgi:predicted DNA-binding transcriptional regulator
MSLSDPVQQFLRESISSVEQLEILIHLLHAGPEGQNAAEVAKSLYVSDTIAADRLATFAQKGLLKALPGDPPRHCVDAANSELLRLLDEIERAYRERRVSLINFIYSAPSSTIQSFADAFIIGKKKGDENT